MAAAIGRENQDKGKDQFVEGLIIQTVTHNVNELD
jgi:hypothetical protein